MDNFLRLFFNYRPSTDPHDPLDSALVLRSVVSRLNPHMGRALGQRGWSTAAGVRTRPLVPPSTSTDGGR